MNDDLRRKAIIRKVTYLGVILALFTVSMFWRGMFKLPIGDPERVTTRDEAGKLVPLSTADRIARLPIAFQAEDLELRDRDSGDPEVASAAAQVSLIGVRGFVVTGLWNATTTAQKRGEYHEMEQKAQLITKLQPHFISPWEFQAWNISYNVSVETDKLGDQYYYIARGISLLADGDRANTRTHRRGDKVYMVGSPDIRYKLGFFTQNKFSVSDKVATLYSLAQLSLLSPDERDPKRYRTLVNGEAVGPVDPDKFRAFCERNPQLVRRLKTKLDLKKPEQVMDFLESNKGIPARFDMTTRQPQPPERAFPVFPVADEGADPRLAGYIADLRRQEETKTAAGPDSIDIRMVARAWFEHALSVVPPPKEGVPAMTPQRDEYDRFRYRIPSQPALIVVRYSPARAQNYVAERLQKEGWFDAESAWNPDAASDRDAKWFPPIRPREPAPVVVLKGGTNARAEWEKTYNLWLEFGRKNGLNPENRLRQEELALATAKIAPLGMPLPREYSDEELAALNLTRENINARLAILYYEQNRQMTDYQKFLDLSLAEMEPDLSAARQLLWDADELHLRDPDGVAELNTRVRAAALWRKTFAGEKHRGFYNNDRSEPLHEAAMAMESSIVDLLTKSGDPELSRRLKDGRQSFSAFGGAMTAAGEQRMIRTIATDEAQARIALAWANVDSSSELRRRARDVHEFEQKHLPASQVRTVDAIARQLLSGEFAWMKQYADAGRTQEWVKYSMRLNDMIRTGDYIPQMPEGRPDPTQMREPPPGR